MNKLVRIVGAVLGAYLVVRLFAISLGFWRFETAGDALAAAYLVIVSVVMLLTTSLSASEGEKK